MCVGGVYSAPNDERDTRKSFDKIKQLRSLVRDMRVS